MKNLSILAGISLLGLGSLTTAIGKAVTDAKIWVGRADGSWSDQVNWRPEAVPGGRSEKVTFGRQGFGDEGETRTVRIDQEVTVGSLKIENTSGARGADGKEVARNYVLAGPGTLVFDAGQESARLEGNSSGPSTPQHRIDANIEIVSLLVVAPSLAPGRELVLSGAIKKRGTAPIKMSIVGNAPRIALSLAGENDFQDGTIEILAAANLKLDSPKAARGATVRLAGEEDSGIIVSAETLREVDFDLGGVDVVGGGAITLYRRAIMYSSGDESGQTYNWAADKSTGRVGFSSITVRADRKLKLLHSCDTQIFVISPGREILLEPGSTLEMAALQRRRHLTLCIGNGAVLRGVGTVTCEMPSLSPTQRGDTSILVDAMGAVAPGTATETGILHLGRSYGETDNMLIRFEPRSELRIRLNGPEAGKGYDQVVLRGVAQFEETKLELVLNHRFTRSDRLYPLVCEEGEFRGDFINAPDGGVIEIKRADGSLGRARVSYSGDAKTQATTGGKDLVIYDFH